MVLFKGLSVSICEGAAIFGGIAGGLATTTPCAELQNAAAFSRSSGKTSHTLVSLQPHRQLIVKVQTDDNFNWTSSNALRVTITFDAGVRVADAETFLVRPDARQPTSGPMTLRPVLGYLLAEIKSVTQRIRWDMDEELSFTTSVHPSTDGKARSPIDNHGVISIGVSKCMIEPYAGPRPQQRKQADQRSTAWPEKQRLEAEGIYTRVT